MNVKPSIAAIGSNKDKCTPKIYEFAFKLGEQLGSRKINLISGGKFGIMEAVFKGGKKRKNCKAACIWYNT